MTPELPAPPIKTNRLARISALLGLAFFPVGCCFCLIFATVSSGLIYYDFSDAGPAGGGDAPIIALFGTLAAAFVFAAAFLCTGLPLSISALFAGAISLWQIVHDEGQQRGKWMALTGIVLGASVSMAYLVGIAWLLAFYRG
jgi:hypothetical protein